MFYDMCLIIALWMLTTTAVVSFLTGGESVQGPLYQLFLYLQVFLFYLLFWRIRGQSLGMQVWKIRLIDHNGELASYGACSIRFLTATASLLCFGLGFFWMLWDKDNLSWQDKASKTRIVYLGKDAYKKN